MYQIRYATNPQIYTSACRLGNAISAKGTAVNKAKPHGGLQDTYP